MTWNKKDKLFEDVVVNTLFFVAVVTLVMTCSNSAEAQQAAIAAMISQNFSHAQVRGINLILIIELVTIDKPEIKCEPLLTRDNQDFL